MDRIKLGIVGFGNLGKGVEAALPQNPDMELVGVFTRRDPELVHPTANGTQVFHIDQLTGKKADIDVLVICAGSATDLPVMTPQLARDFNVVDSFDNHSRIPEHFAAVDEAARAGGTSAIISVGWDPGLFSLNRALATAILPAGTNYTFWGEGVSQGHSDAIRRITGVLDARQYTIPVQKALDAVRQGLLPNLTTREKHTRLCFVVVEEGADKQRIEHEIVTMPAYFADYDTEVRFISQAEMQRDHSSLGHAGNMLRSGKTGLGLEHTQVVEYSLKLESNPEFTSSTLVAYARACYRLSQRGESGCHTVFDIAPAMLMAISGEEMRKTLL